MAGKSKRSRSPKNQPKRWSWHGGVHRYLSLISSAAAGAHHPLIADGLKAQTKAAVANGASEAEAVRSAAASYGVDYEDDSLTVNDISSRVRERELADLRGADLIIPAPDAGAHLIEEARHLSSAEIDRFWDDHRPTRPGAIVIPPTKFDSDGPLSSVLVAWGAHSDNQTATNAAGVPGRVSGARVRLYADFRGVYPALQNGVRDHLRLRSPRTFKAIQQYLQRDVLFYNVAGHEDSGWVSPIEDTLRAMAAVKGRDPDNPPDMIEESLLNAVAALAVRTMAEHSDAFQHQDIPGALRTPIDRNRFAGQISVATEWPNNNVIALRTDQHRSTGFRSAAEQDRELNSTIEQMVAYHSSQIGRAAAKARADLDIRMAESDVLPGILADARDGDPVTSAKAHVQRVLDIRDLPPTEPSTRQARARVDGEIDRWRRFNNPLFDAQTWVVDDGVTQRLARTAGERAGAAFELDSLPSAVGLLQLGTPLLASPTIRHAHLLDAAPTRAISVIGWEVAEGADPPALRLVGYERTNDVDRSGRLPSPLGEFDDNGPPLTAAFHELIEFHPDGPHHFRVEDGQLVTSLMAGYAGDRINVAGIDVPGDRSLLDFVGALATEIHQERLGVHRNVASGEPLLERGYRRRGSAGILTYDPTSTFREEGTGATFRRRTQIWLQGAALERGTDNIRQGAHLRGDPGAIALFTRADGTPDLPAFAEWYQRRFGVDLAAEYDARWVRRPEYRGGKRHAIRNLREVVGATAIPQSSEPESEPSRRVEPHSGPGGLPEAVRRDRPDNGSDQSSMSPPT